MSREIQRYNDDKKVSIFGQSARAIDRARTRIEVAYYAASFEGILRQIEADMILEHELGLPPRRKKKSQSW